MRTHGGQPCGVCVHAKRKEIEHALLVEKTPLRAVARLFGMKKDAIWRHKLHIAPKVMHAAGAALDAKREELETALEWLIQSARTLHLRARRRRDSAEILKIIRELSHLIELKAKISGKLDPGPRQEIHLNITAERALAVAQVFVRRHDGNGEVPKC